MTGRVVLVGAGPGDPDLVTLRAEAELAAAAIVVSDGTVQHLARRFAYRAEVVVVPDGVAAVAALLAAMSSLGGKVVRLYAGDPWLHPAHAEELAALQREAITTEPVAGVAIEVAVPAQAGIAVHVRHLAVACTLGPVEAVPPPVDPARTLVVSCEEGAAAAGRLVAGGGGRDLPAALFPSAAGLGVLRGSLGELAAGTGQVQEAAGDVLAAADPGAAQAGAGPPAGHGGPAPAGTSDGNPVGHRGLGGPGIGGASLLVVGAVADPRPTAAAGGGRASAPVPGGPG